MNLFTESFTHVKHSKSFKNVNKRILNDISISTFVNVRSYINI